MCVQLDLALITVWWANCILRNLTCYNVALLQCCHTHYALATLWCGLPVLALGLDEFVNRL